MPVLARGLPFYFYVQVCDVAQIVSFWYHRKIKIAQNSHIISVLSVKRADDGNRTRLLSLGS